VGGLLPVIDDDCVDEIASWDVEIVLELEGIEDVDIVEELEETEVRVDVIEDVVDAETENCICTCAFAYFGGSFAVTNTVY
jgi:hypothetical protein